MPSQFYGTPLLPKPMQEAHRTLKLGDSRRVNEQDWDTLYHDDYNTSVRIPISLETLKTQTERSPHRHTSGYILTSISVILHAIIHAWGWVHIILYQGTCMRCISPHHR